MLEFLKNNFPLLFALLLSGHGLRKRSLSPSGAIAAFIVGWAMMNVKVRAVGVSLIVFYLTGSRATKCTYYVWPVARPTDLMVCADGKQKKKLLEDGYEEAGYRSGWQVLCNSVWALIASIAWTVSFMPDSFESVLVKSFGINSASNTVYDGAWCPLDKAIEVGWSRALLMGVLGHFACCLGDTLASELGILSQSKPVLITTLKPVPPGTNGGISFGGTLASIIGGAIMGITMAASVILQNFTCAANWFTLTAECIFWGVVGGGGGSMVDSFLGASIQRTVYSEEKKRITEHGQGNIISGLNLLSNNQVNLLASLLTSICIAYLA
ncbi:hypothetical protein PLEOSDRAFT_1037635 [Pleurotus ostreatus PC15]|uniref:Transmembrane protein 19 n=1 Tax=Pleurotus ostreatus (strain PC15) TaxID=1137138 RepID=A0A067NTM7_PLEO1|nr:hypothetical protein PLEOSDRAFT_1037635 [Pleurotus ostreatus PC15]